MEQTKQQRQNRIVHDNINVFVSLSTDFITRFEDLANEVIYDIFDCLDFYHAYEAFSNLNTRFQSLINDPSLPIKINLSSMSKSTFQRYHTQIIISNQHRIKSLHLSNPFMTDLVFSPASMLLKFTRLENLIFQNIKLESLENVLIHLHCLPYLSSLTIDCIDNVENKDTIYCQIFRLPVLKYCKLSLPDHPRSKPLPVTTTGFSPIEYLVITDKLKLDEVNSLLSYVPQLHRLSIHLSDRDGIPARPYTTVSNHLTDISFNIREVPFDKFRLLTKNLFRHVQVLHISIEDELTYLDENRWKEFILSDIPNLRIFNIMISDHFQTLKDPDVECLSMIEQFNSSFWFERQWFFERQIDRRNDFMPLLIFYSIDPYRRRYYKFHDEMPRKAYPSDLDRNINSVQSVEIGNHSTMINSKNYFPNATEVIIRGSSTEYNSSLLIALNSIIPLKQITKISLYLYADSLASIIELLHCTPNIRTLGFIPIFFEDTNSSSIANSESYRLLSRTNNIKEMSIHNQCKLKLTKFLINLCPRLEHLTINYSEDSCILLLQSVLSKDNENTRHLFSLCINGMYGRDIDEVNTFIASKKLFHVCLRGREGYFLDSEMYLWW